MIVPMAKVFVACRGQDRQRLLNALGELGMLHIQPVDPARAAPDESAVSRIREMERAIQVLATVQPAGETPNLSASEACEEVLAIQRRAAERQSRLMALDNQLRQIDIWGNLRLEQLEALRTAGINVQFYSVPAVDLAAVKAEVVQPLGNLPGKRVLIGVIDRTHHKHLPESAEIVPLPTRDAPSIREEAAQVNDRGKQDIARLAQLAWMKETIERAISETQQKVRFDVALRSGIEKDQLCAMQGWVPADDAEALGHRLSAAGIEVAIRIMEPAEDELPPTLIRPSAWASPILGLLKLLGTTAGYREFDVSRPFMLALPLFAAILIGDGGYGALLLLGLGLGYRKAVGAVGKEFTRLLLTIGAVAVVWGAVTGSFFGAVVCRPLIPVDLSEHSRLLMMKISFYMGAIHLSAAQLMQAFALYPNTRFLNRVGWALFVWGVLGVVQCLVLGAPYGWHTASPYLLIAGAALAVLFDAPSAGWIKRIALGVANFPLAMLSAFSDVISYVRLMAVGLASSVLGANFNELAMSAGFLPLTILVLVFGHGLNLSLAMIALFAHGVRLNMLEFSNNLGMQWTGYPYSPFSKQATQEA